MSDIAIAHKDYDVRGGGEILAEELALTFDAPLYVGRADVEKAPTEKPIDLNVLFKKRWQKGLIDCGGIVRSMAYRYFWQQDTADLHDYDTLVLSGNEPLWYIPGDEQTVVAYTHSPPRWMYDLFPTIGNGWDGRLWQAILEQQRQQYAHHVAKPDLFVANSELVARRINRYWNIPETQIRTVYPPVAVETFDPDVATTDDYYITVSRLCSAKRIDWLVAQANRQEIPLKIAGRGPLREELEQQAGPTVEFLGYVSEKRKRELLAGAKAFLMSAENEDFGITPIEAFAAGTPVLTVDEGYSKYQVHDGDNGYTFERDATAFADAIRRFEREGVAWSERAIAAFAGNFDTEQFRRGMREAVQIAEAKAAVDPDHDRPGESGAEIESPGREEVIADGGD